MADTTLTGISERSARGTIRRVATARLDELTNKLTDEAARVQRQYANIEFGIYTPGDVQLTLQALITTATTALYELGRLQATR